MISQKNNTAAEPSSDHSPRTFRLVTSNPSFLQMFITHFALAVDHMEIQGDTLEAGCTTIVFTAKMTVDDIKHELSKSNLPRGCSLVEEVDDSLYGNLGNTEFLKQWTRKRQMALSKAVSELQVYSRVAGRFAAC